MNVFFVDINPVIAAQSLCDKHVVKMVLESAQLLYNAHHISTTHVLPDKFYKLTHRNHPMSLWVNKHYKNYSWLCKHAIGLLDEYTYRYGKIHASTEIIYWCNQHFPNFPIFIDDDVQTITNPPQCMPQEYQIPNKPIESYRQYYIKNKLNSIKCKWTKRKKPLYSSVTVGASGAIYGLLVAFAMMYPHRPIYLYMLFPIPARVFVLIIGAISFQSSVSETSGGVAHATHLGGLVVGYLYLAGKRGGTLSSLRSQWLRWRMPRLRKRFEVHDGGRKGPGGPWVH